MNAWRFLTDCFDVKHFKLYHGVGKPEAVGSFVFPCAKGVALAVALPLLIPAAAPLASVGAGGFPIGGSAWEYGAPAGGLFIGPTGYGHISLGPTGYGPISLGPTVSGTPTYTPTTEGVAPTVMSVPEPGSFYLLIIGLAPLIFRRK